MLWSVIIGFQNYPTLRTPKRCSRNSTKCHLSELISMFPGYFVDIMNQHACMHFAKWTQLSNWHRQSTMTVISVSSVSANRILAEMTDQGTAHTNTHTSSIHSMFSTLSLLGRVRAYLVLTLWRGHQGIRKKGPRSSPLYDHSQARAHNLGLRFHMNKTGREKGKWLQGGWQVILTKNSLTDDYSNFWHSVLIEAVHKE